MGRGRKSEKWRRGKDEDIILEVKKRQKEQNKSTKREASKDEKENRKIRQK